MGDKSERPPKDGWDKFQIMAQAMLALAALSFTIVLGLIQQKNADATLEVARSNCDLARAQVKASLLPPLSSGDANVRRLALSVAAVVDEKFAVEIVIVYAMNDPNTGVRETGRGLLGDLSHSGQDEVRQEAKKAANQYDLTSALRTTGLLLKLQEAGRHMNGGASDSSEKALRLYDEVIKELSPSAIGKLDRGLLMEAQNDEKGGYKELAARKYRSLFRDYGV